MLYINQVIEQGLLIGRPNKSSAFNSLKCSLRQVKMAYLCQFECDVRSNIIVLLSMQESRRKQRETQKKKAAQALAESSSANSRRNRSKDDFHVGGKQVRYDLCVETPQHYKKHKEICTNLQNFMCCQYSVRIGLRQGCYCFNKKFAGQLELKQLLPLISYSDL